MLIKVVSQQRFTPSLDDGSADFILIRDRWNDHGFQTQYELYISKKHSSDDEAIDAGVVKILRKGQTDSSGLQVGVGVIEGLGDDFCSLGQSLDYYKRLSNIEESIKEEFLSGVNDVIHDPELMERFEGEEGWSTSLLRYLTLDDDVFTIGKYILTSNYSEIPSMDLSFSFGTEGLSRPIEFNFDSPEYGFGIKNRLPGRVVVLVGRNGCGKSTLLSKLSRIAYASERERQLEVVKKVGRIEPEGMGFPKILNISYSAFDSFQVPGFYLKDKGQISKEIKSNNGRYIFCGIRDICEELKNVEDEMSVEESGMLSECEILKDRQPYTNLKPVEALCEELVRNAEKIKLDEKEVILEDVLKILEAEASFGSIRQSISNSEDQMFDIFMSMSTGHKFVLHSIYSMLAHTERRTLILFDEPETHLHPPLLAVLMRAIRYILDKQDAFAIVATHSPVVVQETLSKHVNIIHRVGDSINVLEPEIETFGEGVGAITSHVFHLNSDISDFHNELDSVFDYMRLKFTFRDDAMAAIDSIEDEISIEFSNQARSYLLSKMARLKGE
ncbi:MAG: ATP-binding cassette domain-containing protein [Bacteroidetes bacterium]|nr:MAG: ATP-binding cassette domain-containing protein [Bacteroidota bacterium]